MARYSPFVPKVSLNPNQPTVRLQNRGFKTKYELDERSYRSRVPVVTVS